MDEIDKALLDRLVAASGYNWNMDNRIRQAPIKLGGAGFVPLKVYAYYRYIMNFIKHWRTPDNEIGKVLGTVMRGQWKQLGYQNLY